MKDGQLLLLDTARVEATNRKGEMPPGQVAAELGLNPVLTTLLVALIEDWPTDKQRVFEAVEPVYRDASNDAAARAAAAEIAGSCFEGEERCRWNMAAMLLINHLGPQDQEHLRAIVLFGQTEEAESIVPDRDIEDAYYDLVSIGGWAVPGRALHLVEQIEKRAKGDSAVLEDAYELLEAVVDRADGEKPHAMRPDKLKLCRSKFADISKIVYPDG